MENRLSITILDLIPMGITVVDRAGIVTTMNREARQLFAPEGVSPIGIKSVYLKGPPALMEALCQGMPTPGYELIVGDDVFRVQSHLIQHGKDAGAQVFITQNISRIEEAIDIKIDRLSKTEIWFQQVLDCIDEGVNVIDKNLVSLIVNKAWVRITGLPPSNALGQTTEDVKGYLLNPHSPSRMAMETGQPYSMVMTTEVGQKILANSTPIFDSQGELELIVCSVNPLSYHEAMQKKMLPPGSPLNELLDEEETLKREFFRQENAVVESSIMLQTVDIAIKVASHQSTVLILGESGTGKELISKLVHKCSPRSKAPFVIVNCGAIPESLIESELLGYEKGAFTGALAQGKPGLFEMASGGTLFLDEVAELPLPLQVKFLRVLEDKAITRIGGTAPRTVDVRIIAATNRDLGLMVSRGQFRDDLYYRLKVIEVPIPPLRERKDDIIPLAAFFLRKFNSDYGRSKRFTMEVLEIFTRYVWPGNVRELRNVIERLVLTTAVQDISLSHMPVDILKSCGVSDDRALGQSGPRGKGSLRSMVKNFEKQTIAEAIIEYGSADAAAEALAVDRSTLYRKLK